MTVALAFLGMSPTLGAAFFPQGSGGGGRCLALESPEVRRGFTVPASLAREVVLVPARPTSEDVKALAFALHAGAVPEEGGRWRFVRSADASRALLKADVEWLKQRIDATVARLGAFAPSETPVSVIEAYRRRFQTSSGFIDSSAVVAGERCPAARLLTTLLKEMSKAALSRAERGVGALFSNRPMGDERALGDCARALAEYLPAQRRFADWWQSALDSGRVPDGDRRLFPQGDFVGGPRTILLAIHRADSRASFGIAVFDPKGRCESFAQLTPEGPDNLDRPRPPDGPALGRVSLPPDVLALRNAATPGKPDFRAEMLDPVAHEPLDGLVRGSLLAYARAKGHDRIVACVPDDLLRAARDYVRGDEVNLDALARVLREQCEERVVGRTLVLRPAQPLQEEALRTDRRPVAVAFRRAVAGRFDFDALCDLHAAYAREFEDRPFLDRMLLPIEHAFQLRNCPGWSLPHPPLAIVGGLSPVERRRMAQGLPVVLDPTSRPGGMLGLVRLIDRRSPLPNRSLSPRTALETTPTRFAARMGPVVLQAQTGDQTLLRRVSVGYAELNGGDGDGHNWTRKGENIVIDDVYGPIEIYLSPTDALLAQQYRDLAQHYRFLWSREHVLRFEFVLADAYRVGPYSVREKLEESKVAVPLDKVPGLDVPGRP